MDGEKLPAGALIDVSFEVSVPHSATREQVMQWLTYNCLHSGGIGPDNPLFHEEPEEFGSESLDFKYHGIVGRREEFDHEDRADGRYYKVRYIRERAKSDSAR